MFTRNTASSYPSPCGMRIDSTTVDAFSESEWITSYFFEEVSTVATSIPSAVNDEQGSLKLGLISSNFVKDLSIGESLQYGKVVKTDVIEVINKFLASTCFHFKLDDSRFLFDRGKYSGRLIIRLLRSFGYNSDFSFVQSFQILCVNDSKVYDERQLSVKMPDRNENFKIVFAWMVKHGEAHELFVSMPAIITCKQSSSNSLKKVFDRGKEFQLIQGLSSFVGASGDYFVPTTSCVSILVGHVLLVLLVVIIDRQSDVLRIPLEEFKNLLLLIVLHVQRLWILIIFSRWECMIFSGSSWSARDVNWIVMSCISFLCWDTNCYYHQLEDTLIRNLSFVFLRDGNKCEGSQASTGVNEHKAAPPLLVLEVSRHFYLSGMEHILPLLLLIFETYRSPSIQEKSIMAVLNPDFVCLSTAEFFPPPNYCRNHLFVFTTFGSRQYFLLGSSYRCGLVYQARDDYACTRIYEVCSPVTAPMYSTEKHQDSAESSIKMMEIPFLVNVIPHGSNVDNIVGIQVSLLVIKSLHKLVRVQYLRFKFRFSYQPLMMLPSFFVSCPQFFSKGLFLHYLLHVSVIYGAMTILNQADMVYSNSDVFNFLPWGHVQHEYYCCSQWWYQPMEEYVQLKFVVQVHNILDLLLAVLMWKCTWVLSRGDLTENDNAQLARLLACISVWIPTANFVYLQDLFPDFDDHSEWIRGRHRKYVFILIPDCTRCMAYKPSSRSSLTTEYQAPYMLMWVSFLIWKYKLSSKDLNSADSVIWTTMILRWIPKTTLMLKVIQILYEWIWVDYLRWKFRLFPNGLGNKGNVNGIQMGSTSVLYICANWNSRTNFTDADKEIHAPASPSTTNSSSGVRVGADQAASNEDTPLVSLGK